MNGSVEEALASRHGFEQCFQVVDKLRSKYAAAETTYGYLNEARLALSRAPSRVGDGEEIGSVTAEEPFVGSQQLRSVRPQIGEGPDVPATSLRNSSLAIQPDIAAPSSRMDTDMADVVLALENSNRPVGESHATDFSHGHTGTGDFGEDYASLVNLDAMIEFFNSDGDVDMFDAGYNGEMHSSELQ